MLPTSPDMVVVVVAGVGGLPSLLITGVIVLTCKVCAAGGGRVTVSGPAPPLPA